MVDKRGWQDVTDQDLHEFAERHDALLDELQPKGFLEQQPRMVNPGLFSSDDSEWSTPDRLFDPVDVVMDFNLDVCASMGNTKVEHFIDQSLDGLTRSWRHHFGPYSHDLRIRAWMNPPYGRVIGDWITKAAYEYTAGCDVVCLVPARTETQWFQAHVGIAAAVLFLRGRVAFELPCASPVCSAQTPWRYKVDATVYPLCDMHTELAQGAKREKSTAPFPSCLWFLLHDPGSYDLRQLNHLGLWATFPPPADYPPRCPVGTGRGLRTIEVLQRSLDKGAPSE